MRRRRSLSPYHPLQSAMHSLFKERPFRHFATLPIFALAVLISTISLIHLVRVVHYPPFVNFVPNHELSLAEVQLADSLLSNSTAEIVLNLRERAAQRRQQLLSSVPKCAQSGRALTFLMVFMGHSGSTALMTSLQQHSQVHIDGFEPVDHGIYINRPSNEASLLALNYTVNFFSNATKLGKTAGFKIRPRQLLKRPLDFSRAFGLFRTRIVWSYRSNMMKQALGDYTIHIHGDKTAYEGLKLDENGTAIDVAARKTRFRVDPGKLHKLLKSRVAGDRQIAKALEVITPDHCVLPVSYESYLQMPELILERVQMFLGLDLKEMHPAQRAKATQDSICDLVENWDELCDAFFGCETWRWMLDDFENGCSCSALRPSKFGQYRKYCAMT